MRSYWSIDVRVLLLLLLLNGADDDDDDDDVRWNRAVAATGWLTGGRGRDRRAAINQSDKSSRN